MLTSFGEEIEDTRLGTTPLEIQATRVKEIVVGRGSLWGSYSLQKQTNPTKKEDTRQERREERRYNENRHQIFSRARPFVKCNKVGAERASSMLATAFFPLGWKCGLAQRAAPSSIVMGGIDCGRIKERKSKLRFKKEGKQVTHGHEYILQPFA